jgi:hypothetical protein
MKRQQFPVHKIELIPEGFVPLSLFGCHSPTRAATTEYAWLADAWQAGKLSGYKLMASLKDKGGAVYVNKQEADELIRVRKFTSEGAAAITPASSVADPCEATEYRNHSDEDSGVTAEDVLKHVVMALCGVNNNTSEMLDVLTRLTKACEGMAAAWGAKQPPEIASHSVEVCGDEITVFHN